jgi:2',3'-cyclic-nucleotide 2'-phosphodiesterase (5'-nucleotidase family)
MKKTKTAVFLVLLTALVALFTFSAFAAERTVTILHTNDLHGRFEGSSAVIGLDIIAQIKAETENALLVDAGDTIHGLPFVTLNQGRDAVALMNLAGYDVFTPGNHDFNYGQDVLLELAGLAEFSVISANIRKSGELLLDAYTVIEIDGVKIGFFGLTTPETTYKTHPNNIIGLTFGNVIANAEAAVAALKALEVDLIVALVHLGNEDESEITSKLIAESVEGIDIIIDGHEHAAYQEGLLVNGVLIASAGGHGAFLGSIEVIFDEDNNYVSAGASLISRATAVAEFEPNEDVKAAIAAIKEAQEAEFSVVVANIGFSASSNRGLVRTQEAPLGNLIADALLAGTNAQVAVVNGGGIRAYLRFFHLIISALPKLLHLRF